MARRTSQSRTIDQKQLKEALLKAFLDEEELDMMLQDEMGIALNTVTGGKTYRGVVSNLVRWAGSHGELERLFQSALSANPNNPELRQLAQMLDPSMSSTATLPKAPQATFRPVQVPVDEMEHQDIEAIVQLLADQATYSQIGTEKFFRNLVLQAELPDNFRREVIGGWSRNPEADARDLVHWARRKKLILKLQC